MSIRARYSLLFLLLNFNCSGLFASELILDSTTGPIRFLGDYIEYNQELPADASLQALSAANFQSLGQRVVNFGLGQAGIWLRLDVRNAHDRPVDWVLSLNRTLLDQLRVLQVSDGNATLILSPDDRLQSYASYGTYAAPVHLQENQAASLYILYEGANSSILTLTMETPTSIERNRLFQLILFFSSLAGVLTLIVYNTILAIITRLPAFLFYGAAQIFMFSYFAHLSGITTVYIWPETPELGNAATTFAGELVCLFSILFVRSFVSKDYLYPWLNKSLITLAYLHSVFLFILILGETFSVSLVLFNLISIVLIVATLIILPITGIVASRQRRYRYWPMAVAWIWFSVSFFYTVFSLLNLAPVLPGFYSMYMSFAFLEAILLAISLALAVRNINQSRIRAQASLAKSLAAELKESKKSEQLMQERTVALSDLADRGRLLQAAGHDTRQALFALRQFSNGLDVNSSKQRIQTAKESISQLVNHLDDVLATTLAGAHGGAMIDQVLALERVKVTDLLEPIRLIYQRIASQKGLRLLVGSSDAYIVTDRVFMIRILSNLVSNAIKYTEKGGVLIGCRNHGDIVRLQVWDTGAGLEQEQLNTLLSIESHSQRFSQSADGLGSGFQISKVLAGKLDIEIAGNSIPGRGTMFECVLPRLEIPPTPNMRCILLDTDPLSFQWLTQAGVEARTSLPDSSDLPVFIDYDYGGPGKGLSLAEELQELFPHLILTSYDHAADVRNAAAGVVRYLAYKPLERETLYAIFSSINEKLEQGTLIT